MESSENDNIGILEVVLIIVFLLFFIPILLVIIVISSPYFLISDFFRKKKRNKKLKEVLIANNGKIILLYKEYNELNFKKYLEEYNINIECRIVGNYNYQDVFLHYICKNIDRKGYPRLIRVKDSEIIHKEHFFFHLK